VGYGSKWIACRPRYFLTVEVLSALFRRLFLEMLVAAHDAGHLQFFGDHVRLADKAAFDAYLTLKIVRWWHCQQLTSSDRTPLARMSPSVITLGARLRDAPSGLRSYLQSLWPQSLKIF
jgi:hypothetical protein